MIYGSMEGREKRKRVSKLLSSILGVLRPEFVKPRVEVHLLDEGYVWVPKRRGFTEDPKEEISGNQRFQAREVSYPCYYASRGKDSSYFCLFPP